MNRLTIKYWPGLAAIVASGALIAGCNSGGSSSDSEGEATFSLAVTDAPVDKVDGVFVKFSEVTFNPRDGEPFTVPVENPDAINLLELQGPESEPLVTDETIPAGTYNWIRLHLDADEESDIPLAGSEWSFIEIDGERENLFIPSGEQRGLQLNMPGGETISDGQNLRLVIDIDLRKSLTLTGDDRYILRPVHRLVSLDNVGHLTVLADPALCEDETADNATPATYVYEGETENLGDIGSDNAPLTTANRDDEAVEGRWQFRVGFLEPDTYTVALVCNASEDDPEEGGNELIIGAQGSVDVSGGDTTDELVFETEPDDDDDVGEETSEDEGEPTEEV
ncbi:uncharacterized protein DUF4382 [Alkalispirillum mobile]|uniref:Uncharacterized protein DUF4382 n=1 Tax=Alkalispirillum mobile TaxID=85925 RepID=A0A498C9J6_9GAMM|nr:DUF4382 domain-containing protein [Alkalispirillum mobile]RLK50986.1 uncharacterized protein DUF4382 [Alkalispirillum mobile]